jgi:Bcr/CflA subfamily drug resistance transporter
LLILTNQSIKEKNMNLKTLFIILLLIGCLGQMGSDIYAPALPQVAHLLGTPLHTAQLSLTLYVFGLALSQLIYGPLSEGIGRKKPLIIGLCIFILGSVICSLASNIETLMLGRITQGLGAGSTAALWRSIFRDKFKGDALSKYGSYFGVIITFVVPAAPALGGYLTHYLGWHSVFIFLTAYAFISLLITTLFFKDTHSNPQRSELRPKAIKGHFKEVLSHRIFITNALASFLTYGAFFSWFTVGPALLIHHMHMSSVTFGWVCLISAAVAMSLGSLFNARFVMKLTGDRILKLGWGIMMLSGVLLGASYLLFGNQLWAIVAMVTVMYFGATLIWPNLFSAAFTPFGHIAGYAGALYSCAQLLGGAILATLASHLYAQNPLALASIFILAPLCALTVKYMPQRKSKHP